MRFWICSSFVIGALWATAAAAQPRLVGDQSNSQCKQALRLAQTAFASTDPLGFPAAPPKDMASVYGVRQTKSDTSGHDALSANPEFYSSMKVHAGVSDPGWLFWEARPRGALRIAVLDVPFNWQGDALYTYALGADVKSSALEQDIHEPDKPSHKPLFGDWRWRAPLVLQDGSDRLGWIIDGGEPYEVYADWKVYVVGPEVVANPCSVKFHEAPAAGLASLPPAVRQLAGALDAALGSGRNEGTLQPTQAIRNGVAHGWAEVSLRPWALSSEPYNSRAQVDVGLQIWSRGNKKRLAVYAAVRTGLPQAEQALADYYVSRFHLPAAQSKAASVFAIDHMLRSYFVFPADGTGVAKIGNPWPAGVR